MGLAAVVFQASGTVGSNLVWEEVSLLLTVVAHLSLAPRQLVDLPEVDHPQG